MGEIIYSDVQMFAKRLGVNVVGKKKAKATEMVLDAIESDYDVKKDELSKEDFNTYKEENQDMLTWYQGNKDFVSKNGKEEEPDSEKAAAEAEEAEKKLEEEKKKAAAEKERKEEATSGKTGKRKDLQDTKGKAAKAKKEAEKVKVEKKVKGPGVISTILEAIKGKGPVTKEAILKVLVKKFPDRAEDAMGKTIQAQLSGKKRPLRMEREKNVKFKISDKGAYSIK